MPKQLWTLPLSVLLCSPLFAAMPETAGMSSDPTAAETALAPQSDSVARTEGEADNREKPAPAEGENQTLDRVVSDLEKRADDEMVSSSSAEESRTTTAPVQTSLSVPAGVPAFLAITPYVTTLSDVNERFGERARFYEDDRLGKRHIVTGDGVGLDAQSMLISYTVDGRVSDLYLRISADKRAEMLGRLKVMTAGMDPTGIWVREPEQDIWVTKTALLSVSRSRKDGYFSVEYGAAARKALETRAWLHERPDLRCPHFSGLLIGYSDLAAVKERLGSVEGCEISEPIALSDGSTTYTLKGVCFGLPGEVKSYAWFGADGGELTRLEIMSEGDPIGFESVLPALKKRFRALDEEGLFETEHAPARNVWSPRIRFDGAAGKLEFWVESDGAHRAEQAYEAYQIQKKARDLQAKHVDSLFE